MKIKTFVIACALSLFATFSHAEFSYKPKGCEFSVDFPRVPKFEKIYALTGEATMQAQLIDGDNFYRAHCVAALKGVNSSEAKAVEMARKFASNQGLTNPEIRYVQTERGYRMNMRATKMLQGVYATYEFQCSYGRQSYLSVGVGGLLLFGLPFY